MRKKLRTEVRFQSDTFNTSEPRDYFINDGCYGDDVCKRLIQELRSLGYLTDEIPDQEDFGWYFHYFANGFKHCFLVGYQPGKTSFNGTWIGWIERETGFLASVLGSRKRGVLPEAAIAIHDALLKSNSFHNIQWRFRNSSEKRPGYTHPIEDGDE